VFRNVTATVASGAGTLLATPAHAYDVALCMQALTGNCAWGNYAACHTGGNITHRSVQLGIIVELLEIVLSPVILCAVAACQLFRNITATVASVALTGTLLATPANAYDVALGKQVFSGNCAACHTGGNNSVIPEKTLRKAALEQYLDGGFNLNAITYQVCNTDFPNHHFNPHVKSCNMEGVCRPCV
jgi:cytochrome c6